MFSTLTERGAAATLDALSLGASDYVTKPANVGSVTASIQRIKEELLPRVKALGARRTSPTAAPASAAALRPGGPPVMHTAPAPPLSGFRSGGVDVVAIGSSTGGPNALADLIGALRPDWSVPIVITQHMPPMFTRLLAERLNNLGPLTVREAEPGMLVQAGHVYLAPGDFHMAVKRRGLGVEIALNQGPHEHSCRPAVDVLFRSVAQVYGAATLAVVLTGMGSDGLLGCEGIRAAGGRVLTQDEASSVVWGMPGFVTRAGLAYKTLPLDAIAAELGLTVKPELTAVKRPA
jgi:two-component system chemotaxis response regulator CheB